jgi:hypothetical protein
MKITYNVHHAEWVKKEVMGTWPVLETYVVHLGEIKHLYETEYVRYSYETALIGKVLKTVDYSTTVLGAQDKEIHHDTYEIGTVDKQIDYEVMERRPCSCPSCDCPEGLPPISVPDFPIPDVPDFGLIGSGQPNPWQPPSMGIGAAGTPYSPDDARGDFHLALGDTAFVETTTSSPTGGWELSDYDGGHVGDNNIGESETRYLDTSGPGEYTGTASVQEQRWDRTLGDSSGTGGVTGLSGISLAPNRSSGGGQDSFWQELMANVAGANMAFAALVASLGILLQCWPFLLKVIEFLGRARAWVNRIDFLVRWANWLRSLHKHLAGLIFGFIIYVLTRLLTYLDALIEGLEGWERAWSHKYKWDDCRMMLLRGIRYAAEDLRRWLLSLKEQTEDSWRDRAPYNPDYHP